MSDEMVCGKCYGKGGFIVHTPDNAWAWPCDCGAKADPEERGDGLPHYTFLNRAITRAELIEAMAEGIASLNAQGQRTPISAEREDAEAAYAVLAAKLPGVLP